MNESGKPSGGNEKQTRRGVLNLGLGALAAAVTAMGSELKAQPAVPEGTRYLPYTQTFGRMMSFLRDMRGPDTAVLEMSMDISTVPNLVGFVNDYRGINKDREFFASKPGQLRSVHTATGKVLLFAFTYDAPGKPLSISATFDSKQFDLDIQNGQYLLRKTLLATMFPEYK